MHDLPMAGVLGRSTHVDVDCCCHGFLAKNELVKESHHQCSGMSPQDEPLEDVPPAGFLSTSLCSDVTAETVVAHGDSARKNLSHPLQARELM